MRIPKNTKAKKLNYLFTISGVIRDFKLFQCEGPFVGLEKADVSSSVPRQLTGPSLRCCMTQQNNSGSLSVSYLAPLSLLPLLPRTRLRRFYFLPWFWLPLDTSPSIYFHSSRVPLLCRNNPRLRPSESEAACSPMQREEC